MQKVVCRLNMFTLKFSFGKPQRSHLSTVLMMAAISPSSTFWRGVSFCFLTRDLALPTVGLTHSLTFYFPLLLSVFLLLPSPSRCLSHSVSSTQSLSLWVSFPCKISFHVLFLYKLSWLWMSPELCAVYSMYKLQHPSHPGAGPHK